MLFGEGAVTNNGDVARSAGVSILSVLVCGAAENEQAVFPP